MVTSKQHKPVSVSLQPSKKHFTVLPGQSLLESGLGAGIALPFGCANGSCGECKAIVHSGKLNKIRYHDFALTEVQKLNGYCLMCSYTASTDIELEVMEAASTEDIPEQTLQAKLCKLDIVQRVLVVSFKIVRGNALRFLPGQCACLIMPDGQTLMLPIASCPCNADLIEFHFSDEQYSNYTELVTAFRKLQASGKRVQITGPIGQFSLSGNLSQPKLFLSQGGDFSQLQGMIEQVLSNDMETPCALIWQQTERTLHYRANLCRSWHDAFDEFTFVPLPSGADPISSLSDHWHAQLAQCEIYLGHVRSDLIEQLVQLGLDADKLFHPD